MNLTPEMKGEIWRKILHMGIIIFLPIAAISKGVLALIVMGLVLLYLAYESYTQEGGSIPIVSEGIRRAKRLGEQKIARSPFLMFAGVLVTVFLFPLKPAAAGILQLAFADMAAALVGLMWGKRKIPYSPKKSWEGFLAYALISFSLMLLFFSFWESLLLAIAGAFIESLPYKDWDNFLIPVSVAAIASFF